MHNSHETREHAKSAKDDDLRPIRNCEGGQEDAEEASRGIFGRARRGITNARAGIDVREGQWGAQNILIGWNLQIEGFDGEESAAAAACTSIPGYDVAIESAGKRRHKLGGFKFFASRVDFMSTSTERTTGSSPAPSEPHIPKHPSENSRNVASNRLPPSHHSCTHKATPAAKAGVPQPQKKKGVAPPAAVTLKAAKRAPLAAKPAPSTNPAAPAPTPTPASKPSPLALRLANGALAYKVPENNEPLSEEEQMERLERVMNMSNISLSLSRRLRRLLVELRILTPPNRRDPLLDTPHTPQPVPSWRAIYDKIKTNSMNSARNSVSGDELTLKSFSTNAYHTYILALAKKKKHRAIRANQGYLATEEPKFGNRMTAHALVRIDSEKVRLAFLPAIPVTKAREQSLKIYTNFVVALHTKEHKAVRKRVPAEKKRVT
ncbi:hypothetical protein DXG01_009005 [Tephrocybe rancida]|nr:hypothetical protein DXG01_009005 [Tephrocybe rancida]